MGTIRSKYFRNAVFMFGVLTSTSTFAQNFSNADLALMNEAIENNGMELWASAIKIAKVLDPANHRCCTKAPPESVDVKLEEGLLTISSPLADVEYWINLEAELNENLTFEGENSVTVANIQDVRNTFSGQINRDNIVIDVVLGADGELFGNTLEYTLEYSFGMDILDLIDVPPVKPKTVNGARNKAGEGTTLDTNVGFSLQVTRENSDILIDTASVSQNVVISTTITPDPADVGKPADIFIVEWLFPSTFTMRNEDGNFVPWNQSLKSLVPYQSDVTLTSSLDVTLFSGKLGVTGDHRIFVAYLVDGSELYLTPTALRFEVTDM